MAGRHLWCVVNCFTASELLKHSSMGVQVGRTQYTIAAMRDLPMEPGTEFAYDTVNGVRHCLGADKPPGIPLPLHTGTPHVSPA